MKRTPKIKKIGELRKSKGSKHFTFNWIKFDNIFLNTKGFVAKAKNNNFQMYQSKGTSWRVNSIFE